MVMVTVSLILGHLLHGRVVTCIEASVGQAEVASLHGSYRVFFCFIFVFTILGTTDGAK